MAYYRTPHDVTALPAWQALNDHRQAMQDFSMREAFNADPQRFTQFTLSSCGLFLDYSKNLINAETRNLLVGLANEVDLKGAIKSLFDGEIVNASEGRPALHTALRYPERLAGVLALSTYLALPDSLAAEKSTANQAIPIFMAHGTQDEVIPLAMAEQSRRALERAGYAVEWHEYTMPHSVALEEIQAISAWLQARF